MSIYVQGKDSTLLRNVVKFLREYRLSIQGVNIPQKDNILYFHNS